MCLGRSGHFVKFRFGRYMERYSHRRLVAGARSQLVHRGSPGPVHGRLAAIWRASGANIGLNHEARLHGGPARGQSSITRPDLARRRAL